MKAMQAECKTDTAMLAADNLRWQVGLWTAAVGMIGVLIRWPG